MSKNALLREVEPTKWRHLPHRFDLPHAVAFFFHDQLARLVVDLERTGALSVRFDLSEAERHEITNLRGEDLWAWLESTGRRDVINDLTYRQLTAAVVSDAAHFLCEALIASGKGKLSVAYSLLRKPLKESLLLLEWLCAGGDEFLARFHGESSSAYVLNRLSRDEQRDIVERAALLVDVPGVSAELLWVVRYGNQYPRSLETMWTKATHLVTSAHASETEPGNLNFVFSSPSAKEEQWEHFYGVVPLLLYYFVVVSEAVARRFVEWDEELRGTQLLLRDLALLRFTQWRSPDGAAVSELVADLERISFPCTSCSGEVRVAQAEFDRFWLRAEIVCSGCGNSYSVWDIMSADAKTDGEG